MKPALTGITCLTALATAALFAFGAYAATGTIGNYQSVTGTCFPDYILVSAPAMEPSAVASAGNVVIIGPSHVQWVAFKPHIAVWKPGQGWVDAAAGPWKAQKVADGINLGDNSFFNLDTQRWEGGGTRFNVQPGFYYRVWAEYYWYADEQSNAGSDATWATYTYDYRTLDQASREWCQY